jgi:alkanesulfonate monooxygenase SsuD/methylene tetrahydromethanopterin reductase-like flavin-dependent oxidoreductase (luciferase family)
MPVHPHTRDYHAALKEDLEAILHADRLGFDEFWLGEHFSAVSEPVTSPLIFLAQAIPQTRRIKLCTGVINLPQQHPAAVAAHAAMFDQMCDGRFVMGIGPGGLPSDFELFHLEDATARSEMMVESIDMILHMWTHDPPYDLKGKYWHIKLDEWAWPEMGVGDMRRPFQKPHPPIAMSAMSPFSNSVRTAARRGWGAVTGNFIPNIHVASHWTVYQKGAEEGGFEPDPENWRVARNIIVTDTDSEAEAYMAKQDSALFHYYYYMLVVIKRAGFTAMMKPTKEMSEDELTPAWAVKNLIIAGSPQTVAEKILAFREEVGPFGTILMLGHDWEDPRIHKRSMQLMAEQVMPLLNEATG